MTEREESADDGKPVEQRVVIDYTNYKGVRRVRTIIPWTIRFRSTPDHKEVQWMLDAWDVEKRAQRTFSMKDIHSWRPAEEVPC